MIIYVDGSCRGNGTEHSSGGYGIIICNDNFKFIDCYQHLEENTTNNRQELKGILYCLIKFGNQRPIVYSDSAYCVNTLTKWMYNWANNNWLKSNNQQPENLDLIQGYYNLCLQGYVIELNKIKGHNGILGNELADKLATNEMTIKEIKQKYGGKVIQ